MKSPFPGMDPYLELHWEDLHTRLIGYIADELQPQLSDDLIARMEEKVYVEAFGDPIRERSVLIYDSAGKQIITAIEILSPWNKSPYKAMREYLAKREKYLNSNVNLIEIDLVRVGDWTEMIGAYRIPDEGRTMYRVTVVTAESGKVEHYPISVRSKLPTISVPLRPKDSPAKLDLQKLIERAYTMGRYDRIDYRKPCRPPFSGTDVDWVQGILAAVSRS